MKKLLIIGVVLFSSSAYAFSWFNVSGNWVMDRGSYKLKIVQNDKNINVYMADYKLRGSITQKLIKDFNLYAISQQKIEDCVLTSQITASGSMISENTLSIKNCSFSVTDSCFPEEKMELNCGDDLWTKK